jgi:hypothetical protein
MSNHEQLPRVALNFKLCNPSHTTRQIGGDAWDNWKSTHQVAFPPQQESPSLLVDRSRRTASALLSVSLWETKKLK